MLLVEVIMGKETGDRALAMALDFVRAIKKTPIVVNDSRGFYANRCVIAYMLEGHLMLTEGVPAAMVENVAKQAGMPVGPLSLNDEVALDLGLKIIRLDPRPARRRRGRPGAGEAAATRWSRRKAGSAARTARGSTTIPEGGKKRLWPGLADLAAEKARSRQHRHL